MNEIIDASSINDLRKKNQQSKRPIILAKDDEFNRKALEKNLCSVLLSPEKNTNKNTLKNIDSGFNHVLAAIASKNDISIGIDLGEIKKLGKKDKAVRLTKVIQNVAICKKNKTSLAIKGSKDYSNLLLSLGASTEQTKKAQSF